MASSSTPDHDFNIAAILHQNRNESDDIFYFDGTRVEDLGECRGPARQKSETSEDQSGGEPENAANPPGAKCMVHEMPHKKNESPADDLA